MVMRTQQRLEQLARSGLKDTTWTSGRWGSAAVLPGEGVLLGWWRQEGRVRDSPHPFFGTIIPARCELKGG